MRILTASILGAALCLFMTSTSNAEFVFTFGDSMDTVGPGSNPASASTDMPTYTTMLFATNADSVADQLNFYSLTLVSDGGNAGISLAVPTSSFYGSGDGAGYTGASDIGVGETVAVGMFTFAVAADATVGAASEYTGVVSSQSFNDPFMLDAEPMSFTLTAVPEPTSLLMFGSVLAFGVIRRRQA